MSRQEHPHFAVSHRAGLLAAATLCLSIAAVNLPNSLVPLYVQTFSLTPLLQALLFSAYLCALLVTLLIVISRPQHGLRFQAGLVVAALVLCVIADLVMLAGTGAFPLLVAGRIIAGTGAGLATGACAAIALAGLGESARTVAGTAAVVGALCANVLGGILGTLLATPFVATYLFHAALCIVTALAFWLALRRASKSGPVSQKQSDAGTAASVHAAPMIEVVGGYHPRHRAAGYLLGALSWTSAGIVLALVAADLRQAAPSLPLLAAAVPGCVFLASAWVGQTLAGRRMLRLRAWMTSLLLVAGLAGIGIALQQGNAVLLLVAAALCGLGQGPSYSLGLATVTHGLPPSQQGRAASLYAAVAYGVCGALTLVAGALGTQIGVPQSMLLFAVGFAVAAGLAAALAGPPQPLRILREGALVEGISH